MTSTDETSSPEDAPFIRAIKHVVQLALRKAMRRVTIALAVAFCAIIGLGLLSVQSLDTAKKLRQEVITSCNSTNDFRVQLRSVLAQQEQSQSQLTLSVLDSLVTLLEGAHPTKQIRDIASNYERAIVATAAASGKVAAGQAAAALAPRDCTQAYSGSAKGDTRSSAPSASSSSAKTASLFHETAILQGWGGDCLSFVGSPAAGASLNYVDCSVARWWQYYPATGQLRPNADLSLAAGDIGRAALVSASNTGESTLNVKDWVTGPNGWQFAVYYFAGHSNSDMYVATPGQVVSLNSNAGDGARWILLVPGTGVVKSGKGVA
jgi:hypothetical protein